jgi:methylated-DNA-protein-cysteine methyltransferase-like protein
VTTRPSRTRAPLFLPAAAEAARRALARPRSDRWARIHAAVRRVPRGKVATYGQIATLAGLPGHARQVGYALHALPDGSPVPWHRVVNASGRISLPPGSASAVTQRLRLERERVRFDGSGRVDLKRHRWSGRAPRARSR